MENFGRSANQRFGIYAIWPSQSLKIFLFFSTGQDSGPVKGPPQNSLIFRFSHSASPLPTVFSIEHVPGNKCLVRTAHMIPMGEGRLLTTPMGDWCHCEQANRKAMKNSSTRVGRGSMRCR